MAVPPDDRSFLLAPWCRFDGRSFDYRVEHSGSFFMTGRREAMSCGRSPRTQPEASTNQEFIFSREYRAPKLVERLGDYLARSRPLGIAVSAS